MVVKGEHSIAHCDMFPSNFAGKIDLIHSELDAGLNIQDLEVLGYLPYPVLWAGFQ